MGTGSLPSVLWPLLTSALARRPLLDAAPDATAGLGEQISLSKDVNSACATAPFTSGGEHGTSLCGASLPAPSAGYGISGRRFTGLTAASFPRDLAIPQLLLSSASAILPTMTVGRTAVFPHRGLAPHQFAPMSGAHKITGPNAGGPRQFPIRTPLAARVGQFCRSALRSP